MERIEMLKLEDGDYVPKECCTINRCLEVDDVDLPCGADCREQCSSCVIQKIMNAYGEALEKQIPKKPNNIKFIFDFSGNYYTMQGDCPNCGEELFRSSRFCDKCGQALDWGEENGKD